MKRVVFIFIICTAIISVFCKKTVKYRYDCINTDGKILYSSYNEIFYYHNSDTIVLKESGKLVFTDSTGVVKTGEPVIYKYKQEHTYDSWLIPRISGDSQDKTILISGYSSGYACICKNGKYGYIDSAGNLAIKPQFDYARDFQKDRAVVTVNDRQGIIDKKGNFLVNPEYDSIWEYSNNRALVYKNKMYGFLDESGKESIPLQYSDARFFSEGIAAVKQNNYWGYIDWYNRFVIEPAYSYAENFSGGFAYVETLNESEISEGMIIDRTGKIIGQCKVHCEPVFFSAEIVKKSKHLNLFKFCDDFSVFSQKIDVKRNLFEFGYIDFSGSIVIKGLQHAGDFKNGAALVKYPGENGYTFIDKKQNRLFPEISDAYEFSNECAAVRIKNKWGFIKPDGSYAVVPCYDFPGIFKNNTAYVCAKELFIECFGLSFKIN